MTPLHSSTGHFPTDQAHRYMTQLCKHFGHKIPAKVEGDNGTITFEMGTARLTAQDTELRCVASGADAAAVGRVQEIIDRHLARFAFREEFVRMDWQPVRADPMEARP